MDHQQNQSVVIERYQSSSSRRGRTGDTCDSFISHQSTAYNAVFEVNIHAEVQGIQVIMGNKHLLEKTS